MHIRVRDRQLLLTAPGALCVLDLDRKERGKKHASEFQSERNDHNLALCNVNKLHSQGDRVLKRHHMESRYAPDAGAGKESIFGAAPLI